MTKKRPTSTEQEMLRDLNDYLNYFNKITLEDIEAHLQKGIDPNGNKGRYDPIISIAAMQPSASSQPLIELALRYGANPNLTDDSHQPPLFWLIEYNIGEAHLSHACKTLIDAGASLLSFPQEPTWEESWRQEFEHHIKQARERLNTFLTDDRMDVCSLTPHDICLFANINAHAVAFAPDLWQGHADRLEHLLIALPAWLRHDILAQAPWLSDQLQEAHISPASVISDASIDTPHTKAAHAR